MKIFGAYLKVELVEKPSWLDEFRAKFDWPLEYHVTLKQQCFVDEDELESVKDTLTKFLKNFTVPNHQFELIFNKLHPDKEDGSIMIDAEENELLQKFQKEMVSVFGKYRNYFRKESEAWEKNFVPHLTIARELDVQRFQEAIQALQKDIRCVGIAREVVLSVVEDTGTIKPKVVSKDVYPL